MQDETRLTPWEKEIEAALGGLKPSRASMNRDQLMFCAGRASARRHSRIWQGVSGCLGIALLMFAMNRPMTTSVGTGTDIAAGTQPLSAAGYRHDWSDGRPDAVADYVRMRRAVLENGIEALPVPSPAPSSYDEPLTNERLKRIPAST